MTKILEYNRIHVVIWFEMSKERKKRLPSAWSHHPIRSACIAWWRFASWTCTQCTPFWARSSWWSWPSSWRWAWSDHRNPFVFGYNVDDPARKATPCPSCIGLPCVACVSCISYPCKRYAFVSGCSPKIERSQALIIDYWPRLNRI